MTLLTTLRPAEIQTGTNYVDDVFDADTTGATPTNWTLEGAASWTVQLAPTGLVGKVMQGAGSAAVDDYIRRTFTRLTSGELRIRWRVKTPPTTGGRAGIIYLHDTTGVYAAALGPLGGSWSLSNNSGLNTSAGSWVANTVYTVEIVVDLDQRKWKFMVGTSYYDNAGALYPLTTGTTGLDRIKFSVYTPTAETFYIDDVAVGTLAPTAAPPTTTGTLSQSGTFDGVPLGGDRFGRVTLGYANADTAIARIVVERSANNSTWTDISSSATVTSTGSGRWTVTDPRPQYGTQSVGYGGTVYYRLAGANSGGASPTSTSSGTVADINLPAYENARFASLSSYMAGAAVPVSADEGYASNWMLAMAYAYAKTGTTQYLTDTSNEWTQVQTYEHASGVLQPPIAGYDPGLLYRDIHWRYLLHTATTARLLRRVGQGTLADSMIAKCDAWVQAFYNLASAAPLSTIQRTGWDYDNVSGAGAQQAWQASHAYALGDTVRPPSSNGRTYRATVAGTSAGIGPTWPVTNGGTVTDGGVTWTEMTVSGGVSFITYSATAPYPGTVGDDKVDLNQVMEEAATLSLLLTDPSSGLYTAGALRTSALNHLSGTTNLVSAYQTSTGAVPLGDVYPAVDGPEGYDVLYGAYAMCLGAICVRFAPDLINQWIATMVAKALTGWLNVSYATEPLQTMAFSGRTYPVFDEVVTRDYIALVSGAANVAARLRYTAAFNLPSEHLTDYDLYGRAAARPAAQDARTFQFDVFAELLRLDSPRPAVMPTMAAA